MSLPLPACVSWLVTAALVCLSTPGTRRVASASGPDGAINITNLETDAAAQPLGIDDRAPRLSWAIASSRRGVMQTAYRVLVASKPELAREGRADVWDSGRGASSDPWVVYAGPALKPRTRYY